ncbi:MAG: hypothetical protein ABIW76_07330 [Fibrobacteria bacterium]
MSPKLPTALASITLTLGLFLAIATAASSKSSTPVKASASAPASAPATAPANPPVSAPANASVADSAAITPETIVYLGSSGSRYHVKGCTYLKKKGKSISIMDAMKQGYAPCNVCKAPKLKR